MNKKLIRDFLIPTPTQAFWCILLAVLSVLLVYRNVLLERLASGQAVSIGIVGDTFTAQLASLNQYQWVQTGVIVTFWALVGLCTFAIYAAIRNSGSTVIDEVTIQKQYTNTKVEASHYNWVAIRITAAILFLITLQFMWRAGFPYWFGLIEQLLLGTLSFASVLGFLVGFVGLGTSYYLLWLLLHSAIIADRL